MLPSLKIFRLHKGFLVNFRSINFKTRNPREPHFDRKRMLEICKPVFLPDETPSYINCPHNMLRQVEEPHPYDVMLSKELKDHMSSSKMILVYHVNSLTGQERKQIYRLFFKEDLHFVMYNNSVLKLGLEDTKYQALMKLFESSNGVVFAPEISISKALKVTKQMSNKLVLLAGVIDDRFYSTTQLNEINQVFKRNIHGEMLQNLRAPATTIYRSLNYQLNLLSYNLKQISKDEEK